MLNAVLKELNNYFFRYTLGVPTLQFSVDSTFVATDVVNGDFTDTFIAGEYVLIEGSRVNDGVYLISEIDNVKMTIDVTVDLLIKTESTEVTCTITKLFIPPDLIQLISEIDTYNTGSTDGIASESQGNRSVSYEGGSSWRTAYAPRLSVYKKLRWC